MAGDGGLAWIDSADAADVATAVLLDDAGYAGQVLKLTGPKALTYDDMAAELARALGKPVARPAARREAVAPRANGAIRHARLDDRFLPWHAARLSATTSCRSWPRLVESVLGRATPGSFGQWLAAEQGRFRCLVAASGRRRPGHHRLARRRRSRTPRCTGRRPRIAFSEEVDPLFAAAAREVAAIADWLLTTQADLAWTYISPASAYGVRNPGPREAGTDSAAMWRSPAPMAGRTSREPTSPPPSSTLSTAVSTTGPTSASPTDHRDGLAATLRSRRNTTASRGTDVTATSPPGAAAGTPGYGAAAIRLSPYRCHTHRPIIGPPRARGSLCARAA